MDTDKLESLQLRALRFVYADYDSDYKTLLHRANIPTLELARLRALCIEVFKCVHNLVLKYMFDLFVAQDKSVHKTRSAKSLKQFHSNSANNGLQTFVPYSTHLWNNLPNHLKNTVIWTLSKSWSTHGWGLSVNVIFANQWLTFWVRYSPAEGVFQMKPGYIQSFTAFSS